MYVRISQLFFLLFIDQFFQLHFHFSILWSLSLTQTLLQWLYFEFILSKLDENKAHSLSENEALENTENQEVKWVKAEGMPTLGEIL